ncbi:MAG: hypothetical protein LQ350_007726 [Teloschistes chrysophthalmus]|nr:MAG: hypothetical protein LQ350_007726 [Niorma chrysophthalma]
METVTMSETETLMLPVADVLNMVVNKSGSERFLLDSPTPSPKDVLPAFGNGQSPSSLQQIHFAREGPKQASPRENMYVENRDPLRAEEYQSVSTRDSSVPEKTDDTIIDARPLYVNASTQWSRVSAVRLGGNIERAVKGTGVSAYPVPALAGPSRISVIEDPPIRNYKAYEPHAVSSHSSSSSVSSCGRTLNNDVAPPDWQFDAEADLHQILRQKSRKYDFASIAQDSSVNPGPSSVREGGNKPENRREKRFGRILDGDVDYSRFSTAGKFELADSAAQQPAGNEERQRKEVPPPPRSRPRPRTRYTLVVDTSTPSNDPPSPLVPARRPLPHAPSPTTARIQARIYDAQTGERLPATSTQRNQDYRIPTQPQIRIAHFSPIVGGGGAPQQPSPLNFNPPPNNNPVSQILTDQEFPHALNLLFSQKQEKKIIKLEHEQRMAE